MEDFFINFAISTGSHPFLYFYLLGCAIALICVLIVSRDEFKNPDAQCGMIPTVVALSWFTVAACIYYRIKDN